MQVGGTVQGASNIPRRGRRLLQALLAVASILVIAAAMALLVWVYPPATSGDGAQDANPEAGAAAGAAIIHDDAGNVYRNAGSGVMWAAPFASSGVGTEDAKSNAGAGSAVLHDAGNVHPD